MQTEIVTQISTAMVAFPLWVAEVDIGGPEQIVKTYQAVAFVDKIVARYERPGDEPAESPYHADLIDRDWRFLGTSHVTDLTIVGDEGTFALSERRDPFRRHRVWMAPNRLEERVNKLVHEMLTDLREAHQGLDHNDREVLAAIKEFELATSDSEKRAALLRIVKVFPQAPWLDFLQIIKPIHPDSAKNLLIRKLMPDTMALVWNGNIKVNNAYLLASLPRSEHHNYHQSAMSKNPTEFTKLLRPRIEKLGKQMVEDEPEESEAPVVAEQDQPE